MIPAKPATKVEFEVVQEDLDILLGDLYVNWGQPPNSRTKWLITNDLNRWLSPIYAVFRHSCEGRNPVASGAWGSLLSQG
jgi:hypothetical protein